MTGVLPPACVLDCPDGNYWRAEALACREVLPRTGPVGPLVPGPCLDCRAGCPVIGGPCTVGIEEHDEFRAADQATDRATGQGTDRDGGAGLLAYDDTPTPMTGGERLMAAALAGPWLACTAGFVYFGAVLEVSRRLPRWIGGSR